MGGLRLKKPKAAPTPGDQALHYCKPSQGQKKPQAMQEPDFSVLNLLSP